MYQLSKDVTSEGECAEIKTANLAKQAWIPWRGSVILVVVLDVFQ